MSVIGFNVNIELLDFIVPITKTKKKKRNRYYIDNGKKSDLILSVKNPTEYGHPKH